MSFYEFMARRYESYLGEYRLQFILGPPFLVRFAQEMQNRFKKFSRPLRENPDNDWLSRLCSLGDELNGLSSPSSVSPKRDGSKALFHRSQSQLKVAWERPKHPKKRQTPFAKSEFAKLAADINSLKDDTHVLSIFSILKRCEPSVETDFDKLEFDIAALKIRTLNALREKVDQCLGVAQNVLPTRFVLYTV